MEPPCTKNRGGRGVDAYGSRKMYMHKQTRNHSIRIPEEASNDRRRDFTRPLGQHRESAGTSRAAYVHASQQSSSYGATYTRIK